MPPYAPGSASRSAPQRVGDGLVDIGRAWDLPALGTVTLAIYPGATARNGPGRRFIDAAVAGLRSVLAT